MFIPWYTVNGIKPSTFGGFDRKLFFFFVNFFLFLSHLLLIVSAYPTVRQWSCLFLLRV